MIKSIELTRFKKYQHQSFSLNPTGVSLLVGGNNAGKSTLIQALSVWAFCKMILHHEKGRDCFNKEEVGKGEGFGMSAEEFLPVAVPSLNHLWTNLKTQLSPVEKNEWGKDFPGYNMRIKCTWNYKDQADKFLEIGLSLINDRLFIRVTKSNLSQEDYIPEIVYLPTFAGVLPKENKATQAERRAFLGRGMAGSIIRNMIYDLYQKDSEMRTLYSGGTNRLRGHNKDIYEKNSPLQKLQRNLRATFRSELEIEPFNETFHTVIKIYERKVKINENMEYELLPKSEYSPRDIITQGSGYLQWLSIFCVLYSPRIDVLLLDEPDAHLHASLQCELLRKLLDSFEGDNKGKQIFISTHSVEIIKQAPLSIVYSMESRKYLGEEKSRVALLSGIGSEYCPQLDQLKRFKKMIFVENESDIKILNALGEKCGLQMPSDVVYWPTTDPHAHRRHLFDELHGIIPELKCISLRDRDMDNPRVVKKDLTYTGIKVDLNGPLLLLEWRRKNIESYFLCPKAISLAANQPIENVKQYFQTHALSIPDDGYIESDAPDAIMELDGKQHFSAMPDGIETVFRCNKYDVVKQMTLDQVCEDIKKFFNRVHSFFNQSGNLI